MERIASNKFDEKYVVTVVQPLDHSKPEAGSFSQRFIVSHAGFDAPTVLVTEGYRGDYGLNPNYREDRGLFLAEHVRTHYNLADANELRRQVIESL